MKKALVFLLMVVVATFALQHMAWADKATPKEIVQKVEEAAKLIAEKGEEAFGVINDKNGPFVWKDTYCFVFDMNGTIVAHPDKPGLIGKNLMNTKDVKGKIFAAEFVAIAKSPQGKGWSEYYWPKPGEKEPSLKVSYIAKVPGRDYLVGAGVYDLTKEEAEKAASN